MSQAQYLNGWDDGYTAAAKIAKKAGGSLANVIALRAPYGDDSYYYATKFSGDVADIRSLGGHNIARLLHNGVNFILVSQDSPGDVYRANVDIELDEHHEVYVPFSSLDPVLVAVVASGVGTQKASFRCIKCPRSNADPEGMPYGFLLDNTSPEPINDPDS